jgi:hypothetical protein
MNPLDPLKPTTPQPGTLSAKETVSIGSAANSPSDSEKSTGVQPGAFIDAATRTRLSIEAGETQKSPQELAIEFFKFIRQNDEIIINGTRYKLYYLQPAGFVLFVRDMKEDSAVFNIGEVEVTRFGKRLSAIGIHEMNEEYLRGRAVIVDPVSIDYISDIGIALSHSKIGPNRRIPFIQDYKSTNISNLPAIRDNLHLYLINGLPNGIIPTWAANDFLQVFWDDLLPIQKKQLANTFTATYGGDLFKGKARMDVAENYREIINEADQDIKNQLSDDLCSTLLKGIQDGQLKHLIGIGKAFEIVGSGDIQVDFTNAERVKFLLMHLPKSFWKMLRECETGSSDEPLLPIVQQKMKGYLSSGAPERPALDAYESKLLAIADEVRRGGNGKRYLALQKAITDAPIDDVVAEIKGSDEPSGVIRRVFNAKNEEEENLIVRENLKRYLINRGELSPGHTGPLPLKYSTTVSRMRQAAADDKHNRVDDVVAKEIKATEHQFWRTVVSKPKDAADSNMQRRKTIHAAAALAHTIIDEGTAQSTDIFESGGTDLLRTTGSEKQDPGLQEYLAQVLKNKVQTYFPNTVITDQDVKSILGLSQVVYILQGENCHLGDLTPEQRLEIFKPFGLGENLENLEVNAEDGPKLLEFKQA